MRLHRNQLCPIHRSLSCCGREQIPRENRRRQMGVRPIEDGRLAGTQIETPQLNPRSRVR